MITHSHHLTKIILGTTSVIAALLIVSCVSTRSSPEQVEASNPTVTYKYRNDDELIQANQRAITFCQQYPSSLPRTASFSNDSGGSRIVVFECVPTTAFAATPLRQSNTDLTYNYRTDQQLLDASREAQVHCLNNGLPEMDSHITVNADGSKTVTYRCSQR